MLIPSATWSCLGEHLTRRLRCWRRVAVPMVQTSLAAGLSWFVAVHLFGHRAPFFAPVAAIVSIDMTPGQRLRRAIELIVGAGVGIGVGALLISAMGAGPWQIGGIVALATSVAVLLNGRAVINVQGGYQQSWWRRCTCPGDTSGIDRLFDGLIGAAIGLVIVAVFARSSVCGLAVTISGTGAGGAASPGPRRSASRHTLGLDARGFPLLPGGRSVDTGKFNRFQLVGRRRHRAANCAFRFRTLQDDSDRPKDSQATAPYATPHDRSITRRLGMYQAAVLDAIGGAVSPRVDPERDLLAALQRRDPAACELLVACYGDRAYRLAIGITHDSRDAEEAVSDAFWSIVRKIDTFRGDAALGSWIYRIVANAAYQKLRRQARQRDEVPLDEILPVFDQDGCHVGPIHDWSAEVDDPAVQRGLREVLESALDELPPHYRAIFVLHDVEGMSMSEAATSLGVTVAVAKSRAHRARLLLRKRLSAFMEGVA